MGSPRLVDLPGFQVAGISVMTTNKEMKAKEDIGALWYRFTGENLAKEINNRLNEDLYCIYTAYEDQDRGTYKTLLGCKVHSIGSQPAGISGLELPPLKYQVYVSEGDLGISVIETWMMIWKAGLKRSFIADFDLYPEKPDADGQRRAYTYVSL